MSPASRTSPQLSTEAVSARGRQGRALEHAVDDPAAAAAAEDHCVRPLQHLDAVDVVEVAEILDVVAHPVDEEVRGAGIAAQYDRVAIAFARIIGSAGDEQQEVADRAHLLVRDLRAGDDAQRLGDVLDVGVGLGGAAGAFHAIFHAIADDDDLSTGGDRGPLSLLRPSCLRRGERHPGASECESPVHEPRS